MVVKIRGYTAEIDPLHRNHWPVRCEKTGEVIGVVVEHITVTLDIPEPPVKRWSWHITEAEVERLGKHWVPDHASKPAYLTHDDAYAAFTDFHRMATRSLDRAVSEYNRKHGRKS